MSARCTICRGVCEADSNDPATLAKSDEWKDGEKLNNTIKMVRYDTPRYATIRYDTRSVCPLWQRGLQSSDGRGPSPHSEEISALIVRAVRYQR